MISITRTLLLFSYALFWGGLTFYTGFAVRIAHDVLSDPMDGGMITQRVTVLLQYFAAATVVLMLANAIQVGRKLRKLGFTLAFCAITLGVTVGGLVIVHGKLDAVIDVEAVEISDREVFAANHQRYNQLTTVQWIASLVYLPLTVVAWRKVDGTSLGSKQHLQS